MIIWGNHSATQVPDLAHAKVRGEAALNLVSRDWYLDEFIPAVQQRGAAIIKARGASSAASAASAAIDHVRDWVQGTPAGQWVSMAVASDGSYGIGEGVVYSYPVTCADGSYTIVQDLDIDQDCRTRMDASHQELLEERAGVEALL
jgi:malate dehydrogenase